MDNEKSADKHLKLKNNELTLDVKKTLLIKSLILAQDERWRRA